MRDLDPKTRNALEAIMVTVLVIIILLSLAMLCARAFL